MREIVRLLDAVKLAGCVCAGRRILRVPYIDLLLG